jgi:Tol biopolymer transport system component
VFVIDADGRNERAVATLAGSNTMPVWTPDGAHVVFVNVNTPSGRRDLYLAPVGEGGRATEPVRLRTDFVGEPLRISRSGDLFYHQSDDGFDQMIAERRDGSARIVQVFPGMGGSWSKSGDKLAFLRLGLDSRAELVIRSLETGRERSYLHAGIQLMPPRWLSDDSAVIVQIGPNGDGGRPGGSFYRVDIQTGDFKWLFARDAPGYVRSFVGVVSPDDKTFYLFARVNAQAPWTRIVGVDLATGVERAVVTLPEPGISDTRGLAISPDGSTLAIYASDGRIMTVRTDGRDLHELRVPLSSRSSLDAMKWTPDGRAIVVAAGNSLASFGWHMRQISTVGDQAQIDGLDSSRLDSTVSLPRKEIGGVTSIDLSPDGSRIALASRADRTIGIWMLAKVGSPQQRAR